MSIKDVIGNVLNKGDDEVPTPEVFKEEKAQLPVQDECNICVTLKLNAFDKKCFSDILEVQKALIDLHGIDIFVSSTCEPIKNEL